MVSSLDNVTQRAKLYSSSAMADTSPASSSHDVMSFPSFSSAYSAPRPTSEGTKDYTAHDYTHVDASTTLGQFSFAPATQTTVVTTTTTTTTKFPPFVMRAPRRMQDLDPKLYPLAATPTPAFLRNVRFDLAGKPTLFYEAEDASVALEKLQEERESLRTSNGAIRTVESFEPQFTPDIPHFATSFPTAPHPPQERPVSPESIIEPGDGIEASHAIDRSRTDSSDVQPIRGAEQPLLGRRGTFPHPRITRNSNPATPDTDGRTRRQVRRRSTHNQESTSGLASISPLSPHLEQQETLSSFGSRAPLPLDRLRSSLHNQLTPVTSKRTLSLGQYQSSETLAGPSPLDGAAPTPPIEQDGSQESIRPSSRRNLSAIPSRLNAVDNSSINDGSLPSPSLSPVTAASNLQNTGYFADIDSNSELASQQGTPSRSRFGSPIKPSNEQGLVRSFPVNGTAFSINDIPAMLDFFEAIPDELKSYVMHQLLRRCPKPTLHVVADTVNPALKCDFLGVLPPELALNIVKFLDLQSMCRASQVSKKWRRLINSDEKHWKELFESDGLVIPQGELQRAISEGWGWQDPYGSNGFEQDISVPDSVKSESDCPASSCSAQVITPKAPTLRRPKRKATAKLSNRNKQVKRKEENTNTLENAETTNWFSQAESNEGPYNAANSASLAVPYPQIGLPSLKSLHLFKSLYRRHYLIRRNWLREEAKPRHIAFRAHENHVVTCLQFDTDKILTGSDDNNINVYDTKTGAIRAKLRGHEGGVWALQYEGNTLVSGSTDRSVRVWDIERGVQTQVFRGHTSTVRCLQILLPTKTGETYDGKPVLMPRQPLIITGSRDSNLRVWKLPQLGDPEYFQEDSPMDDTECPYFVRTLIGHSHSVRAIAAHADTLVSGSYDCTVRVWKISTGETVHRLQGHSQKVYSVVLDNARNRCISGSMDNLVKIWSLDTGSQLYTLDGHSSLVGLLDLNCERLVSAAADSTLRIWDPENGQCKATLSAHTGAITCFQHDAQKVISGSDRTLKMWNIKTGECIKDLLQDLSGVWQVKFNERRCVAAVQRDNMTYIEVLDFGAARDGVPESKRGRRIVVDAKGQELNNEESGYLDLDGNADGLP